MWEAEISCSFQYIGGAREVEIVIRDRHNWSEHFQDINTKIKPQISSVMTLWNTWLTPFLYFFLHSLKDIFLRKKWHLTQSRDRDYSECWTRLKYFHPKLYQTWSIAVVREVQADLENTDGGFRVFCYDEHLGKQQANCTDFRKVRITQMNFVYFVERLGKFKHI